MPPRKRSNKKASSDDNNDDDADYLGDEAPLKKKSNASKIKSTDDENEAFDPEKTRFRDYSNLKLKPDNAARPIWVTPDGSIYLEAFSPIYQQAYDFLVAIAEPVSRPEHIHEYRLTSYSLYAAIAVSIDTESIINVLQRLCKTELPEEIVTFIRECTNTFGKAKLVLKDNHFFVESAYPDVLRELLKNPTISEYRLSEAQYQEEIQQKNQVAVLDRNKDGFITSAMPEELKQNLDYLKLGKCNLPSGI